MSEAIKIKVHCMVNRLLKKVVITLEGGLDIPALKKQGFIIESTKEVEFNIKPVN